ncbi:MAG: hypothetical protein BWX73_00812 [Lentisphaerae bacterium ADurb.Bin082]|nr:MAG: hypothetical protein BWX73_00812 [Lentisphaerae bacterium ADurb.Bin082]HQL87232.1 FAD-dependent oxidoreductase [Lentisphaeria bacterium]
MRNLLVSSALLLPLLAHAAADSVLESERSLPLAADVDIVVVGGSSSGVAAANAAARAGASVFLAAPRMYLGEDLCAPYQLWLPPGETPETPLLQAMFPELNKEQGLTFEYTTSRPSTGRHVDSTPPRMLNDGQWDSVYNQSVEFDGDVDIVADLGSEKSLHEVRAMVFQSPRRYAVRAITVATSVDGKTWQEAGVLDNPSCTTVAKVDQALTLAMSVTGNARYVRFQIKKCELSPRFLIGELQIFEPPQVDPLAAEKVRNTTPMQVKTALEEELLNAGVDFVYGSAATEILRDETGHLAGVVIANRAGRQAIRAKLVIDATTGPWFARLAGAETAATTAPSECDFKRIVIGGEMKSGAGITACRAVPLQTPLGGIGPASFGSAGFGNHVQKINAAMQTSHEVAFEYTLRLPLPSTSFAALAEAEQKARDLTFDPGQVEESETLLPLVPETMPTVTTPGYCRVPTRDGALAARLNHAAKTGRDAAAAVLKQPVPKGVFVAGEPATAATRKVGEVYETLADFRPLSTPMATIPAPASALPVLGNYDVVVLGGGTSGAPAAISAARSGAKTLVLEYLHALGGTGTVGLIGIYCAGYREGFTAEVDRGIKDIGSPTYIVGKQEYWRREIRTAGGDIWFGVLGCGAYRIGDKVTGVVVATPAGRGVVLAKVVIDGTGNADLAAAAGAETAYNSADDEAMQGTGLPYRAPGASYINTDWTYVDEVDMVDVTTSLIAAKRRFRGAYDLCQLIDTRERRRIVGDYTLDPLDIINKRRFPDTIQISQGGRLDKHGSPVHPYYYINNHLGGLSYTPYRCLLPRGLDGILVVGIGLSAHRDAIPSIRMQPCLQNLGYAAGLAAAMAARDNLPTRSIDLKKLQALLVDAKCLTPDVPEHQDSYPMPLADIEAAVQQLVNQDYGRLGILMAEPERALPLLRQAYSNATTPDGKLRVAHILGMMGDATGLDTLLTTIRNTAEYEAENISTYFPSITWLDSYILAAGRSGNQQALPILHDKAKQLLAADKPHWKHIRTIAMALEAQGARDSAEIIAKFLQRPGVTGAAITDIVKDKRTRDRSGTQELVLARVLYNLGDLNGLGEKSLRSFTEDLRSHYRRHALAVLQQPPGKALRQ